MGTKRKGGGDFFKAQAFTQKLRTLTESLPSEADQQQVASQLETLIRFLSQLRDRLTAVPSRDGTADVRAAIDRLDALFTHAKTSPFLAAAVGVSARPPRPKRQPLGSADIERAKSTLARLEPLPIDELRTTLGRMDLRELQAVAAAMGIRTTQRTTHVELAHQVATKITNVRGYRSLRDGTDDNATE